MPCSVTMSTSEEAPALARSQRSASRKAGQAAPPAPEPRAVILLPQVHQLVDEHVLGDRRRHLDEPEVQRDRPCARARAPARSLIPDRDPARPSVRACAASCLQPRDQPLAGERRRSRSISARTSSGSVTRTRAVTVVRDRPRSGIFDRDLDRLPVSRMVLPAVHRTGACSLPDARPFARDPRRHAAPRNRVAFRPRSAARNRHAQRAVRPDAQDVAAARRMRTNSTRSGRRADWSAAVMRVDLRNGRSSCTRPK